jgi:hypothetical protein
MIKNSLYIDNFTHTLYATFPKVEGNWFNQQCSAFSVTFATEKVIELIANSVLKIAYRKIVVL